jgi:uncharacterized metal-binding protein YceD (DUF177 family)
MRRELSHPGLARPELSRIVALDRVGGERPLDVLVEATPDERMPVAARLMIPEVLALTCRFALRREPGRIVADGDLSARVVRDCVITLEPFATDVAERFRVHFVPEGSETDDADDPLAPDQIPYAGSAVDLGELAVEQLALALDPYPRHPDAVLEPLDEEDAAEAEAGAARQPFAALAGRLRRS